MTLEAPILENRFVRLEPLEEGHRTALSDVAADPDLWRFASVNQHAGTHGGDFDAWVIGFPVSSIHMPAGSSAYLLG